MNVGVVRLDGMGRRIKRMMITRRELKHFGIFYKPLRRAFVMFVGLPVFVTLNRAGFPRVGGLAFLK